MKGFNALISGKEYFSQLVCVGSWFLSATLGEVHNLFVVEICKELDFVRLRKYTRELPIGRHED